MTDSRRGEENIQGTVELLDMVAPSGSRRDAWPASSRCEWPGASHDRNVAVVPAEAGGRVCNWRQSCIIAGRRLARVAAFRGRRRQLERERQRSVVNGTLQMKQSPASPFVLQAGGAARFRLVSRLKGREEGIILLCAVAAMYR